MTGVKYPAFLGVPGAQVDKMEHGRRHGRSGRDPFVRTSAQSA